MIRKTSLAWRRLLPGKASDFIRHIDELRPGDRVVLCCRVSHCNQDQNGNLDNQERHLRLLLESKGVVIVDAVKVTVSGTDPSWILNAVLNSMKEKVFLVAESTSRFVRHPAFHSQEAPDLQARRSDLEDLREWSLDVPLFTALDPDASPEEEKSFQTNRGITSKGKKGGRPRKKNRSCKARREAYLPIVMELHEAGKSYREIAGHLNSLDDEFPDISYKTIGNWINGQKNAGQGGS
jgi:DNA invertase Pin-like site-specific DNA recombinase